jgi:hypothetical protein
LEDFAEENVKYIEVGANTTLAFRLRQPSTLLLIVALMHFSSVAQLRTTPKDVPPEEGETEGMTKRQYVAAVLSTIDEVL